MPTVDEHAAQPLLALRQCVLAVSVMSDLDATPTDDGVLLPGACGSVVEWSAIQDAVAGHDACGPTARHQVETLLRLHQSVIDLGREAGPRFESAARVIALPPGHIEHPGPHWVRQRLRGDALELGIGVQGLISHPDRTVPAPPSVLESLGVDPGAWWPRLREHTERMGALSASRLARDGSSGVIRPIGGCDVLALLASRTLRRHLASGDSAGMRALAAPTRLRGWYDVSRIDPAFIRAAWSLTDEPDRGLPVPLLITVDDVVLPVTPD